MSRQVRFSISDAAYEALTDACKERHVTQGEVVTEALLALLQPTQDHAMTLDILLTQAQETRALLYHIADVNGWLPGETPEEETRKEAPPYRIASYDEMYTLDNGSQQQEPSEQVPEAFRSPQPRRGRLARLLFKDVE